MVVIGPCSIHDTQAAVDYARRLIERAATPRRAARSSCASTSRSRAPRWAGRASSTTRTWTTASASTKACARRASCCCTSTTLGLPAGTEFLDLISPQYIADLIAWGAIGARTTEIAGASRAGFGPVLPGRLQERHRRQRQDRRRTRSRPRSQPHHFLSVTKGGHSADRLDRRQRGLPRDPARRQAARTTTPRRGSAAAGHRARPACRDA